MTKVIMWKTEYGVLTLTRVTTGKAQEEITEKINNAGNLVVRKFQINTKCM
jgi:prophage DNA circulation protein